MDNLSWVHTALIRGHLLTITKAASQTYKEIRGSSWKRNKTFVHDLMKDEAAPLDGLVDSQDG